MESMKRDLKKLPKAEIHLHWGGAMRYSTLEQFCVREGIEVPKLPDGPQIPWEIFDKMYFAARDTMKSKADFERVMMEKAQDFADDGAVWMEYQIDVSSYAKTLGMTTLECWQFMGQLAKEAEKKYNIGIGFTAAAGRYKPPSAAETLATEAVAAKKLVPSIVGFGLQGDEKKFPPEPFAKAFQIAIEGGLTSVPHAGETCGEECILATIASLHPKRLGHGIKCVDSEEAMKAIRDRAICCEVCPTSNVKLSGLTCIEEHPLPQMIKNKIPCSLGSDDPLQFGSSLLDEYILCREKLGLTDEQLAQCARNSISYSGAPVTVKQKAYTDIKNWLRNSP